MRYHLQRPGSLHANTDTRRGGRTVPEEFLQTGVTEPVSTGGHLDGLPHRLAAERTLEPSLRLLQELIVEAWHVCRTFGRFPLRAFRLKSGDALLFLFLLPPPHQPTPVLPPANTGLFGAVQAEEKLT